MVATTTRKIEEEPWEDEELEFDHKFSVPVPVEEAWGVLLDIERIAPCMPGAALQDARGDEFTGTVTVKVGPMKLTYGGTARIVELDERDRRAVVEASGKETRGSGSARAIVTSTLSSRNGITEVEVRVSLSITGRPAQFGRGAMTDIARKLLDEFAECLAAELGRSQQEESGRQEKLADAPAHHPNVPTAEVGPSDAIDLIRVAGGPVIRRVAPLVLGILVVVAVALWVLRA